MEMRTLWEARWILAAIGAGWAAIALVSPPLSLLPVAMFLFVLYFFRDPRRIPAGGEDVAVAPADGLVTTVDELREDEYLHAKVRRVGIFLSVLDVHVNRAPIAGVVLVSHADEGRFLDARDPMATLLNASRSWVISGPSGKVMVRQITGAIARRICPWSAVGDKLARGERFGMIRFGSRTEIFLPCEAEVLVQPGDRVRGGETPVARMPRHCHADLSPR